MADSIKEWVRKRLGYRFMWVAAGLVPYTPINLLPPISIHESTNRNNLPTLRYRCSQDVVLNGKGRTPQTSTLLTIEQEGQSTRNGRPRMQRYTDQRCGGTGRGRLVKSCRCCGRRWSWKAIGVASRRRSWTSSARPSPLWLPNSVTRSHPRESVTETIPPFH